MTDTATETDVVTTEETPVNTDTIADNTVEPNGAGEKPKITRRTRGALEADVKRVCDEFVTGKTVLKDGELLTPHRIAVLIKTNEGLSAPPSTGAVAAVLSRWLEIGFATLNGKPMAFVDYTDEGRSEGLTALKAANSERKRTARAAVKAAEKSAAPTAEPVTSAP